jgi:hypothetical protein
VYGFINPAFSALVLSAPPLKEERDRKGKRGKRWERAKGGERGKGNGGEQKEKIERRKT